MTLYSAKNTCSPDLLARHLKRGNGDFRKSPMQLGAVMGLLANLLDLQVLGLSITMVLATGQVGSLAERHQNGCHDDTI